MVGVLIYFFVVFKYFLKENVLMPKRVTETEFLYRAELKHGDDYDYINFEFINMDTRGEIFCNYCMIPFWQTPKMHVNQGNGCYYCGLRKTRLYHVKSKEVYIKEATEMHEAFYDYILVNYINDDEFITIICPIHGIFEQRAGEHVRGKGCKLCGTASSAKKKSMLLSEFIRKSNLKHNDFYTYLNVIYINNHSPVWITCPIHGDFDQLLNDHLAGKGCDKCGKIASAKKNLGKFRPNAIGNYNESHFNRKPELKIVPAKLYFFKFWNDTEEFYSTRSFTAKYKKQLIESVELPLYEAFLETFKEYKYIPKIKFGGWTECFTSELYNLIYNKSELNVR